MPQPVLLLELLEDLGMARFEILRLDCLVDLPKVLNGRRGILTNIGEEAEEFLIILELFPED